MWGRRRIKTRAAISGGGERHKGARLPCLYGCLDVFGSGLNMTLTLNLVSDRIFQRIRLF